MEPAWGLEAVSGLFAASDAQAWIARRDARAAGFALCRRIADESELLALGVLPTMRRAGVASALLDTVMAGIAGDGVRTLFLEVAEDNLAALALYAAAGFATVGHRAEYYRRPGGAAMAALVLRTEIRPS